MHKHQSDLSALSGTTVETSSCLTGGTREISTPEKHTLKKRKYIKPLSISPPIKDP